MKFLTNYITESRKSQIEKDIETTLNGIVMKTNELPYHKQVEAIERIRKAMQAEKEELSERVVEIDRCLSLVFKKSELGM